MGKKSVLEEKWLILLLAISVILLVSATGARGATVKSFSAKQVTVDPNGKIVSSGMIYVKPEKIRMDFKPPEGEGTMINIFRRDRNLHWMLSPEQKKYVESPYDEAELQKAMQLHMGQTEKILGTETVNGFKCTKKEVETTVKFFGISKKSKAIVWQSDRLEFPVRTQTEDGTITELRDFKAGRQSSKLFEIPAGYAKVANMMELFAGASSRSEGGSNDEGKDQGSFDKIQKDISDTIKNFKWPFGGKEETSK